LIAKEAIMRKLWVLGFVLLLSLGANGGGCSNPNAVGVQQYGTIVGRILDATNNRPVGNVLVSVGSIYTAYSDPTGAFTLSNIPIGHQQVTASAPGYERNSATAMVHDKATTSIGYLRIMPLTGGSTAPPPATPTPTAGPATPIPAETPTPSATASTGPGQ
jgi:carboxypeptidase family protein